MNRSYTRRALVSIAALAFFVCEAACSEPDWAGAAGDDASGDPKSESASTEPASDDDEDCSSDDDDDTSASSADPTKIDGAACCEDKLPGKAHCVAEGDLPDGFSKALASCDSGGLCVPDSLRGGAAPKSCDSGFGGEFAAGVCLSLCLKAVAADAALLSQTTCGKNEVCAPCISPKDNKSTQACDIGDKAKDAIQQASAKGKTKKPCAKKSTKAADMPADSTGEMDAPPADGAKPATGSGGCCSGKGLCVPKAAVSEDEAKQLEAKECAADKVCAPQEMADRENFKPKTCKGSALTGDFEGVCLSTCLVFGTLQKLASGQGDCDDDHRCMPCEYPVVGGDTGAPGCKK